MFWDLFGEQGHPIRATVFEMGPLLISRMLSLNDVQEGVINIAFRYADDDPELKAAEGSGLIDLKDLRELLPRPLDAEINRDIIPISSDAQLLARKSRRSPLDHALNEPAYLKTATLSLQTALAMDGLLDHMQS